MKLWLETPVGKLSRQYLLDEHCTVHALIKMYDNPRFKNHPLCQTPRESVYKRHSEQVQEMNVRGYHHKTPIKEELG